MIVTRSRAVKKNSAISTSLAAPVGGWNARDVLGSIPEQDAVVMENWFPTPSYVMQRLGYTQHATGIGAQVQTLMAYSGLSSNKLVAAAGGKLYEVTSSGAVGAAMVSGLTSNKWQWINYENTGGNYLYIVNGQDAPKYWDGTTWTDAAITGVTPSNLVHICAHKGRIWFAETGKLKAWYLAANAIAGAATAFDISGIAQRGGYLMAIGTWTIDAGTGVDDLLVFITSQGEAIVYKGTDPSSGTTWALVGVWWIGSPVGRKCLIKYAGDLLYLCQAGITPLSGALQSSRVNPRVFLTDKIQFAVSESVTSYGANYGWQMMQYPKGNMLILNVPVADGSSQQQYVMNTIHKAWCKFTGWQGNCWELFNEDIYFGGNGFVGKAWVGNADNGANINSDCLQAFSYFKSPGRLKRFTMMRPALLTDNASVGIGCNIAVDFDLTSSTPPLTASVPNAALWDSALWDSALWGGDVSPFLLWQGTTGIGYSGAPRIRLASHGINTRWISTDIVMEPGGVL